MFESPDELDPAVRTAYLARLGVEAGPPSVGTLTSVVQRQVERVPYETFWIPTGERWSIGPALHEPLPLAPGVHVQEPFRLTHEHAGDSAWALTHDPAGDSAA